MRSYLKTAVSIRTLHGSNSLLEIHMCSEHMDFNGHSAESGLYRI